MKKKYTLYVFLVLVILSGFSYAQDPFNIPDSSLSLGATNGIVMFDYNNDGNQDVFLTNGASGAPANKNFLYIGNGDGSFTKQSTSLGDITNDEYISGASSSVDYDNDGDEDLMVVNVYTRQQGFFTYYNENHLFSNDGDGTFTEIGFESEHQRYGAVPAFADVNKDGLLDLLIVNSALQGGTADNKLYMNSSGTFSIDNSSNLSSSSSARAGCSWIDYDQDGDMDAVIASGSLGSKTSLWTYNGTNFSETILINTGGGAKTTESLSWGDYDNDGDFDLFVANSGDTETSPEANMLFNNSGGTLTSTSNGDLTTDVNLTTGSAWGDYDNDGDLDLAQSIFGTGSDGHHSRLYTNVNGVLSENTNALNIINTANFCNTVVFSDVDNDGDMDLIFGRDGENLYFENNTISTGSSGATTKFTNIKCVGNSPSSNRSAIGTILKLYANLNSTNVIQVRDISSQTGRGSQNDMRAHFGLRDASKIDTLKAKFPSGVENKFYDLPVDKLFVLKEGATNVSSDVYPAKSLTYLFGSTGGSVEFTSADTDGGSLNVLRTDSDPAGTFDGTSSTTPSGPSITPNAVYADKYWTISQTDLTGFTASVYLDASGLTGTPDLDDVVILKRANSGSDWTPLNTSRIGNTLYSSGITSFSEFAIGYVESNVLVETKIFLQGAYDVSTDEMKIDLLNNIPTTSPYSEDSRTVASVPSNIVDWILVELRSTDTGSAVASKSAFLHKDGRIVNDDASSGVIEVDAVAGDYYIVIKHRNHLAVMSMNLVTLSTATSTLYDFTN